MLLDHRTYTCRAGTIRLHLALYEEHGYAAQSKHLGAPLLYAATETGDVNSYVHVWAYDDAADRTAKRAALANDAEWTRYLTMSREAGYLIGQVNTLMTPVSFVPHARP
ncbi:NIPSNAP family protein [Acuticoccus sp.]|uniref:NIPSNAP family protein n=1 Tax=Acuticoccus sp. TaxID=1904378 RepID=UPI003B5253B8